MIALTRHACARLARTLILVSTLAASGLAFADMTISIAQGWNLLGNSGSTAFSVASVFGDSSKVNTVWKWNVAKSAWAFYTPAQTDGGAAYAASKGYESLSSISGGEGFWVNANSAFSTSSTATSSIGSAFFKSGGTLALPSGWSLIATGDSPTPSAFNRSLSGAAAGTVPVNLTTLWAWDNTQANWYFYAPALDAQGGTVLTDYISSKKYLDFGSKTLAAWAGFWVNLPEATTTTTTTTSSSTSTTTTTSTAATTTTTSTTTTTTQILSPPTAVSTSEVSGQAIGTTGVTAGSSSKLTVSWTAPTSYTVDHYEITATEALMSTSVSATALSSATSATLTPLKAATAYSIVVKACKNSACSSVGTATAVSATTPNEYWQLQGTGNTVSTLTKPVSDGNARLSATRFGAEAGTNANTVQFYYGPKGVPALSVATSAVVSSSSSASYLTGFTSYATTSGLRSPTPTATSGIKDVNTGQGVPLSTAMGAKVRLFFESNDADGKTRIYSVDSVDGYVGRDFSKGTATTCTTSAEYLSTGDCPASVVIGVSGDTVNPTNKITAARQNKIAWPTMTDWRWDGAVGTFMVFTIDAVSGCTTAFANHAYAVWDGSKFVPQYDSSGCPKAFKSAQAALPMHIGDVRYKMYFGDVATTAGKVTGSTLPFLGPKKLIYADGRSTGSASIVDFEDWEDVSKARDVVFLWPNGEKLNDAAEGYIDDFHFLTPTGSLDIQVLYLTITDGSAFPFAATAVLLNP